MLVYFFITFSLIFKIGYYLYRLLIKYSSRDVFKGAQFERPWLTILPVLILENSTCVISEGKTMFHFGTGTLSKILFEEQFFQQVKIRVFCGAFQCLRLT
uniref:Uncharacterized protein n=1 Tax=Cacopsylla melanoneura TaxID=428564 RepID=A0A8D9E6E8_9HEMI